MILVRSAVLFAAASFLAGCDANPGVGVPPASAAPKATISLVNGVAPKNAIVTLLPAGAPLPMPDQPAVMDQYAKQFVPAVLITRVGQPVEFRNSDDTLHNVHVDFDEKREPAFNVAIPTGGSYTYSFKHDGFYRVGCDIHPAMAAMIYSTTTPFAALAAPDGRFAFDGVPPGAWTITVYAAGKRLQRDVEVGGGLTSVTVE